MMTNSKANLLALVTGLEQDDNTIIIFGGWAAELKGAKKPWPHSDVDLLLLAPDFDNLLQFVHARSWRTVKSYAHKQAFMVGETMVEVFLVKAIGRRQVTEFVGHNGHVAFGWPSPLFTEQSIDGRLYKIASDEAVSRYTQQHRAIHSYGSWK